MFYVLGLLYIRENVATNNFQQRLEERIRSSVDWEWLLGGYVCQYRCVGVEISGVLILENVRTKLSENRKNLY